MHKVVHPDTGGEVRVIKNENGTVIASVLYIDGIVCDYAEPCPECGREIPVLVDPDDYENYEVVCPVCGKQMMLCLLCQDDCYGKCDWCEETGCYRQRNRR